MSELKDFHWLTDDSIDWEAWCYNVNPQFKTTKQLLDFLIDVVSKNGAVLLNVTPTQMELSLQVQQRLRAMGEWLRLNGEAIYDTRPWVIYGEGLRRLSKDRLNEHKNAEAVAQDIRFTTNGDQLYATTLDWPEDGRVVIRSLATGANYLKEPVTKVNMLGSDESISGSR